MVLVDGFVAACCVFAGVVGACEVVVGLAPFLGEGVPVGG